VRLRPFARRLRSWATVVMAAFCCIYGRAAPTASEVQLKAAFIFHFTQFISWPAHTFEDPNAPFVIGIVGDEPIDEALTEMVRGERVDGHPLQVRRLSRPADAANCQIVYSSGDGEEKFRAARFHGEPVLTVGETEGFLQSGGMIEFITEHNHVKLRINLPAAKAASLQISSKLLRVAQVLSPE